MQPGIIKLSEKSYKYFILKATFFTNNQQNAAEDPLTWPNSGALAAISEARNAVERDPRVRPGRLDAAAPNK